MATLERYVASGLTVVDTFSGDALICDCTTPDVATPVALALNLALQSLIEPIPLTPEEAALLEETLTRWNAENAST